MVWTLNTIIWSFAALVLVTTALPLSKSVRWWVRACEFPRLHIASAAALLIAFSLVLPIAFKGALIAAMAICAIYQAIHIFPYTPFARKEIERIKGAPSDGEITLLSANVLMENTNMQELIGVIDREDPDVLFLMETDQDWLDALQPCLGRYPTLLTYPLDNHYGIIFATRLKAPNAEIVFLSDDNTPTIRAELLGPDGTGFNFIGLHPRPPVPGSDTLLRDQQIKLAAKLTGNANWPTVSMGDFNDVAWSWTSRRFKRLGGFLEPRVGRGMLSTFHAHYWFLRVPIDQLYLTRDIGLVSFERLEDIGSDHFPVKAVITFHDQSGG